MSVYEFSAKTLMGEEKALADYKGNVLIIVNTASKCGFTPQFKELQELYDKYKDEGLEILGFPCNQFMNQDPGTDEDIQEFCQLNFGVSFQMFSKIDVNGKDAHPLYAYLASQKSGMLSKKIKWNFTKFLVDRQGEVIDRYAPQTSPAKMEDDIKKALQS
ncbi:glutathione peroxidase [Aureibacillus halotolerans]|uniref:Glutathione peroxidase n=1 Tax=Aureibacillus halotolerans TaxID=1508390 RepID=A0A4R6U7L7_9BACI|nr:glutathione peroxidase [Aureibacillus halotolerans]TDQ40913.1 glutathione peroxidase [Aureibacillus halotolerans]